MTWFLKIFQSIFKFQSSKVVFTNFRQKVPLDELAPCNLPGTEVINGILCHFETSMTLQWTPGSNTKTICKYYTQSEIDLFNTFRNKGFFFFNLLVYQFQKGYRWNWYINFLGCDTKDLCSFLRNTTKILQALKEAFLKFSQRKSDIQRRVLWA